jgi:hypothetical protein
MDDRMKEPKELGGLRVFMKTADPYGYFWLERKERTALLRYWRAIGTKRKPAKYAFGYEALMSEPRKDGSFRLFDADDINELIAMLEHYGARSGVYG